MGDWYNYKLRFVNEESVQNSNLSDHLIELGLASRETHTEDRTGQTLQRYRLDIQKIKERFELLGRDFSTFDFSEDIIILENPIGIPSYYSKWTPDDRIVKIIAIVSESIIEVERTYYGMGGEFVQYYESPDGEVNKNGEPLIAALYNLNPKLLKDTPSGYQISIPIGEENDKWGTIAVPKENVTFGTWTNEDGVEKRYGILISFTEESIPVKFKAGVIPMLAEEISALYHVSKNNYRDYINESIYLEIPSSRVQKKTNSNGSNEFFVVKIPCSASISVTNELSFAAMIGGVKDAGNGNYVIDIGPRGKGHLVYTVDSMGVFKKEQMTNPQIEAVFQNALWQNPSLFSNNLTVRNQEDIERYHDLPYIDEGLESYRLQRLNEQQNPPQNTFTFDRFPTQNEQEEEAERE